MSPQTRRHAARLAGRCCVAPLIPAPCPSSGYGALLAPAVRLGPHAVHRAPRHGSGRTLVGPKLLQHRRLVQTLTTTSLASSSSSSSSPTLVPHCAFPFPSNPKHPSITHFSAKSYFTNTSRDDTHAFRLPPLRSRLKKLVLVMGSAHQTRDHGGHHGHSHSHAHHDNSFLISANTSDPGVRITRIGLLSNLLMAIAKFIGGWTFGSKAMVADAWHSITDLASDILTLATVSWSIKPPSDRFPLGFGKVESLGSLGVSGMLVVGGFYMGWESAISLFGYFSPELAHTIGDMLGGGHGHGHSHSHSHTDLGIPSLHAAWLAGATILIKEWLYQASTLQCFKTDSAVAC